MSDLIDGQKVKVKLSNGKIVECVAKGKKALDRYEELYPNESCLDDQLLVIVNRRAWCEWECQLVENFNEHN